MEDHVYHASLFWSLFYRAADVARFFGPWLILLGTLMWAVRSKSWIGYLALLGGVLLAGAHLAHSSVPMVRTVSVGGPQPLIGENPIVVLFYLYGAPMGELVLGCALIAQFIRSRTVA